jgi:hypothetical protein
MGLFQREKSVKKFYINHLPIHTYIRTESFSTYSLTRSDYEMVVTFFMNLSSYIFIRREKHRKSFPNFKR